MRVLVTGGSGFLGPALTRALLARGDEVIILSRNPAPPVARRAGSVWVQELAQIDTRLEKLAAERAELEAQLASGTMSGAEIAEAGRRLNHVAAETGMLEERWLELQTEIEALQAEN